MVGPSEDCDERCQIIDAVHEVRPRINGNQVRSTLQALARNQRGTLTASFRDPKGDTFYVKLSTNPSAEDLNREVSRSAWLEKMGILVAEVVSFVAKHNCQVLLTRQIPGQNGVAASKADFEGTLLMFGRELKRLHTIPIHQCPFVSAPEGFSDAVDSRVIHGDPTLPNIVVTPHHRVGFLDCGDVGVGSRYFDFAAVEMSLNFNHPGNSHQAFFRGYELDKPDMERLKFFRRVYEGL